MVRVRTCLISYLRETNVNRLDSGIIELFEFSNEKWKIMVKGASGYFADEKLKLATQVPKDFIEQKMFHFESHSQEQKKAILPVANIDIVYPKKFDLLTLVEKRIISI